MRRLGPGFPPFSNLAALLALAACATPARPAEPPLPRYDLAIRLDPAHQAVAVCQRVTWTNPAARPATQLTFNAHARHRLTDTEVGFYAKMLEIERVQAGEAIDTDGQQLQVTQVFLVARTKDRVERTALPFAYDAKLPTALRVELPQPVGPCESVSVDVEFTFRLSRKQGRWGCWHGVTALSHWLPTLAVYDGDGWQPVPFVPWHQPVYQEAGIYSARVQYPAGQIMACTGPITETVDCGNAWQEARAGPCPARDFALVCGDRFHEWSEQAGGVRVRCLARPEHEHHARTLLRAAVNAVVAFTDWFGPLDVPELTIAETGFVWDGGRCSGLVLMDERVFELPHAAAGLVECLVTREVAHQWWFNTVGTDGFRETFLAEGLCTHAAHRLLDLSHGRNSSLTSYPDGLGWLPGVSRDDYRYSNLLGTLGRGESGPTLREVTKFDHVVQLYSLAYDRGGKIFGMIEARIGDEAFLNFLRSLQASHRWRILRAAELRCELEAFTGQPWGDFFRQWVYGAGHCDWSVESVALDDIPPDSAKPGRPCRATVVLRQKAEINEPTALGICLDGSDIVKVRLPIDPALGLVTVVDPPAFIEPLKGNRVRVEVTLPCRPTQIVVDPDQVILDPEPANNTWKPRVRWRVTPLYSFLEESDLTCAYDRWNVIAGPWFYEDAYDDPWYSRPELFGFRLGAYRTQQFQGGAYAGFRPHYRDVAAGVDGLWPHLPIPQMQVGFNVEKSIAHFEGDRARDRGVLFTRYVFDDTDSFYLPPMHYTELFGAIQTNPLPDPRHPTPGADRFTEQTALGLHYHLDYLTPYWDPEGGFRFDATYAHGVAAFGEHEETNQMSGQGSVVGQPIPDELGWLADTKVAARLYLAGGLPDRGQFYSMGGNWLFRGFDLRERQGSGVWVASVEWRLPLATGLHADLGDHVLGLRNVYMAPFYDAGNAYLSGRPLGPVAHAVGAGLRLDVAWCSLVERTMFRFDVAKTVNESAPVQFWLGLQHPF